MGEVISLDELRSKRDKESSAYTYAYNVCVTLCVFVCHTMCVFVCHTMCVCVFVLYYVC